MYKLKTLNAFELYFHFFFSKEKLMDVYRAAVTFFIPMEEMDFCLFGYCVISVSKASNK